jgi:hypothetical protein
MVKLRANWATIWQPGFSGNCILIAVLSCSLAGDVEAADKPGTKATKKAKPDLSATDTDEPDADSGSDVDDDLSALVLPADLLGSVKKSNQLQFSQSLRGLLLEGMTADGAAASKRHFEAAHLSVPDDPRPAYAYGVALLVQKNPNEALTQFRAAARKAKAPFLPAMQALAWVHFSKNDYKSGLADLSELAGKIEESKASWPTEHDKNHAADWLGRIVGYLTIPGRPDPGKSDTGKSSESGAQIDATAQAIEKLLTGDRKAAFDQGRKHVARRYGELKALAARPVDEVLEESRQKREEARTAAQSAAASVKAIEEEIRTIKKPFDQQIADAEKEIRANGTKTKKLAHEIPDAEEAVQYLSQPQVNVTAVRPSRYRPTGVMVQNETAQQKKAREAQLATAKQNLQQIQSSIDNAKQSVSDARKQRDQAKADLKKALADKRAELVQAQRVSHEMAAAAKDAERALQTPESIKSRVTALETYVPLDPECEKTRLLATLKSP